VDLHDVKIRRGLLGGNLELAAKAIDSGAATGLVERWAEFSRRS
jgi:anthranilate phosphoribosyltransferase